MKNGCNLDPKKPIEGTPDLGKTEYRPTALAITEPDIVATVVAFRMLGAYPRVQLDPVVTEQQNIKLARPERFELPTL